ncbi:gene transfer agent family protein [Brevundimonas sp.]|uniref:gene transfer agent family protein n=1 Tax=Brevundimonas sp. TaxID=1871086 RepID=UPI00289E6128|nr:gene transfer agent family protein [Brevundimonas sp.]
MSRNALVEAPFGDGVHRFRLAIGQLEELQEKTDCGPEELWSRVSLGTWRVQDLIQTIRLGLIGGGMDAMSALALVGRYVDSGNLVSHKPLVQSILGAALVGAPDEDAREGEDQAGKTPHSPAEKSASATSTKRAGNSGGRRKKSETPPSGS